MSSKIKVYHINLVYGYASTGKLVKDLVDFSKKETIQCELLRGNRI